MLALVSYFKVTNGRKEVAFLNYYNLREIGAGE